MSAPLLAARGNRIFPVETFGDTLIVSPKGDKAGFGEADFRVECSRVAAALRDPFYRHLIVDFSLTNYVGGSVVEEVQKWVAQCRDHGGRAVACEVSEDMRKGLELAQRSDDWEFFETRDDALKSVATETPGQTIFRWTPRIATFLTVAALLALGAWLLSGRHLEERRFAELEAIWKEYADIRGRYASPREWKVQNQPLVARLEAEIEAIQAMEPSKFAARDRMKAVAKQRMLPVLRDPRMPDPRARGVEAGFASIRANLAGLSGDDVKEIEAEYIATAPLEPEEGDGDDGATPEQEDDPAEQPPNVGRSDATVDGEETPEKPTRPADAEPASTDDTPPGPDERTAPDEGSYPAGGEESPGSDS
ncbi:MAG: hypothetical protein AAF907_10515 [Planctomycetota bacterium]